MIERKFIQQRKKEFKLQTITEEDIKTIIGHSKTKLIKTPLGEKIVIYTSKPGVLLGKKGDNVNNILTFLKKKIDLDNPEIEVREVEEPNLDPKIIAEKIGTGLERFGVKRAKWLIHRALEDIMSAKAMGAEIRLTGKIQGGRSKSLRVYSGYLKKCGETAKEGVRKAERIAKLKLGVIGIKVSIMPQDIKLGDKVEFITEEEQTKEETVEKGKKETKKKKSTKSKKKTVEKEEKTEAKKVEKKEAPLKEKSVEVKKEEPKKEEVKEKVEEKKEVKVEEPKKEEDKKAEVKSEKVEEKKENDE